ncbi:CHAP domain-containing protein [Nocardia sp. NPDC019395]|uniref:C40 family peptidase n=1 Tax=Nocardia sp. NPDC019395 TaxID=3154686 RepID=UPI0033C72C4E
MSPTTAEQLDITLPHPEGSSWGLDSIIDAVQEYIQRHILLLASGDSGSQPDFVAWLDGKGLLSEKGLDQPAGKSVLVENYSDRRKEVEDRVAELERQNKNIDSSKFAAFDTSNRTYQKVRTIVRELKRTLNDAPPPSKGEDGIYRLSAATEFGLTRALLTAVDRVHDEVGKAKDDIDKRAQEIDRSVPSIPARFRGGGGGAPAGSGFRPTASQASFRPTNPDDAAGTAVEAAESQLGVREYAPNLVNAEYNIKGGGPWCASFTSWAWEKAGYDVKWTNPDYVPSIWNDAAAMGLRRNSVGEAQPGDLIVFDWEGDGTPDHIGIVKSVQGGQINTIEGNTSNQMVERNRYGMNSGSIVGVVKPPPSENSAISA